MWILDKVLCQIQGHPKQTYSRLVNGPVTIFGSAGKEVLAAKIVYTEHTNFFSGGMYKVGVAQCCRCKKRLSRVSWSGADD